MWPVGALAPKPIASLQLRTSAPKWLGVWPRVRLPLGLVCPHMPYPGLIGDCQAFWLRQLFVVVIVWRQPPPVWPLNTQPLTTLGKNKKNEKKIIDRKNK